MESNSNKVDKVIVQHSNEYSIDHQLNSPQKKQERNFYWAWLFLCFTTGPVASMSRTYVPASIQSVALILGHTKDGKRCSLKGNDCYIRFGSGEVHYTSYVLYTKAIATALEGVVSMLLMGIADYANYRKWLLIGSVALYGVFALPFGGLISKNYETLRALASLYCLLIIDGSIYQILEGSYIPVFMRYSEPAGTVSEDVRRGMILKRGSKVSVMGLFLSNCGGIAALIVGIIISYGRGMPVEEGYRNFLLAISIAGGCTILFATFSSFFIPDLQGKKREGTGFILFLSIRRFIGLIKSIKKYPHAFIYCISWVIWNVSYSNFLSVYVLLFRSTLGIGSSDSEYTVYTFMSYLTASLGALAWVYLYPRCRMEIKTWGYLFLTCSAFTNFWGCLGISSKSVVGFKSRWEFWLFEVLYSASSSSMRCLNRAVYSTLLPEGEEAQYFGLEVMLGVATGWIGSLVNATIQDRTNNDRYPFLPNLFLVVISLVLYAICDTEQGMRDVKKIVQRRVNCYHSDDN